MNQAEYNKIKAVNWSTLKHMRTSPKHYQHAKRTKVPTTSLMRMGSAAHCLVLEPDKFGGRYPVFTGKSRRGKAWDAYVEDHPGIDPNDILIESEYARVESGAAAVLNSPAYTKYIKGGQHEVVLQWTDPDTGIKCKGRADGINGRVIELKFLSDFARIDYAAAQMCHHGQCSYYGGGAYAMGLLRDECPPPVIICVESVQPHDVAVLELPNPTVDIGTNLYKRLLRRVKECTESGEWPGKGDSELWLPAWAEAEAAADDEDITIGGVPVSEGVYK